MEGSSLAASIKSEQQSQHSEYLILTFQHSVVPLVEQDPSRCQVSSEEGRNVRASLKTFYQDKLSDSFGALVLLWKSRLNDR